MDVTNYKHLSLYLQGFIHGFEDMAPRYGLKPRAYSKDELLTQYNRINNTAHYIRKGIMHFSLMHSSGSTKSLAMFGPGTIFPLGVVPHENHIDYELVLRAFTDLEVYSLPYPLLRQICVENGMLSAMVLEENCEFIGYLFYRDMNQTYAPSYARVCDVLYLYLRSFSHQLRTSQKELADLAGVSLVQLERCLKELRGKGIVHTTRGCITILDPIGLLDNCTDYMRETGEAGL